MNKEKLSISLDDLLSEIIDKEKRIEFANPEERKSLEERVLFLKGEIKKIHQKVSDLENRVMFLENKDAPLKPGKPEKKVASIKNTKATYYSSKGNEFKNEVAKYKRTNIYGSYQKLRYGENEVDIEARKMIQEMNEVNHSKRPSWINSFYELKEKNNQVEDSLLNEYNDYEEGFKSDYSGYDDCYEDYYQKEKSIRDKINSNFMNNIIEGNRKQFDDYMSLKFKDQSEKEEYIKNIRIWFYRVCEDEVKRNSKYTEGSQMLITMYFVLSGLVLLWFFQYVFLIAGGMLISLVFLRKRVANQDIDWLKFVDEKIGLNGLENYNNNAKSKALSQVKELYFPLPILLSIAGVNISQFEDEDYYKNATILAALKDDRIKNSLKIQDSTLSDIK